MMMSNQFFTNLDTSSGKQQPIGGSGGSNGQAPQTAPILNNSFNFNSNNPATNSLLTQFGAVNKQQNNNQAPFLFRSSSTTPNPQQFNASLLQQQQQKKLLSQLNFNSTNSVNNNGLVGMSPQQQAAVAALSRQFNNQLSVDNAFSPLDPSEFPILHPNNRSSHSPFQQHQMLQQQFRNSGFSSNNQNSNPATPLLSQNLIQQLANLNAVGGGGMGGSSSGNSMMMLGTNNSSKMWSNFSSSKDLTGPGFKTQQSVNESLHQQEFQIQQEDFPALPRPQSVQNKSSFDQTTGGANIEFSNSLKSPNSSENLSQSANSATLMASLNKQSTGSSSSSQTNLSTTGGTARKGIVVLPDGHIKNVPPTMLLDQYGMAGLLSYIKSADKDKDLFMLATGNDLTALGLNLNSNEILYHSFSSPFSDSTPRLQDIDFPAIPTEYMVNSQIKDKLPLPLDVTRYPDDTLFYLFYMYGGDILQLQAAAALYDRDWRYHVEKRVWLTKVPGMEPMQKMNNYEKGVYMIFDVTQWRKIQAEMTIEYHRLAEKTLVPPQLILLQQQQIQQQQLLAAAAAAHAASNAAVTPTNPISLLPVILQQQYNSVVAAVAAAAQAQAQTPSANGPPSAGSTNTTSTAPTAQSPHSQPSDLLNQP